MPKKEYLCLTCSYYKDICTHKSNECIRISKKVETKGYISKRLKTECEYYSKV